MRRVGYYHCEHCFERRLFVLWEPPWDEYAAICVECSRHHGGCADGDGWAEGGYTIREVVETDEDGHVSHIARIEPVLTQEALIAGKRELQAEIAEQLRQSYGTTRVYQRAYERLRKGLDSSDPEERALMLRGPRPEPADDGEPGRAGRDMMIRLRQRLMDRPKH